MARLHVEAVPAGDAGAEGELERFLAACPGAVAQQTLGWRRVIASLSVDEPLVLACRREGELVGALPAYRYAGPLGAILTSCAQAGPLGGVTCAPGVEPEPVYAALLRGFTELAQSRDCALATVLSNPFWPDRELCERYLEPHYVLENACQVLDLDTAFDAAGRLVGASRGLRRNLARAQRADLRIDEEQGEASVEAWYAIHVARQAEIGATPLPHALVRAALAEMVARDKGRFFFVRRSDTDELVGGGLYIFHGAVIDAVMPAARTEHARLGAGFLLAEHSIRWARARGLRFYNWQASPPGSGTARWKRQWGSRDAGYCYLTRVTGDAQPFLASSVAALRSGYPGHFTLPFDRVGETVVPPGPAYSSRRSAWDAGATADA